MDDEAIYAALKNGGLKPEEMKYVFSRELPDPQKAYVLQSREGGILFKFIRDAVYINYFLNPLDEERNNKDLKCIKENFERNKKQLVLESLVNQALFSRGFPVPRNYGVYNFDSRHFEGYPWMSELGIDHVPGFAREFIPGRRLEGSQEILGMKKFEEKKEELNKIYQEVKDAGFHITDEGPINAILHPSGKIYLIDFESWQIPRAA